MATISIIDLNDPDIGIDPYGAGDIGVQFSLLLR
jgi:hypothetical protein